MSQNSARLALRSRVPFVLVEAPAGCGKTHEAAAAAVDLATELHDYQEVLLLAHTNAAVQEFRTRIRSRRARVRALTLDAFALELVSPYAEPLCLPTPLRVGEHEGTAFSLLAPKLAELLRRSPSLSRALALHYPVIVLDEHQDARSDQHEAIINLASAGGVRLRIFGDPMQAIYEFGKVSPLDWSGIKAKADINDDLDEPRRWDHNRELGEWILEARRMLESGRPIPVRSAPQCVNLVQIQGLDDVQNPNSRSVIPAVVTPLCTILNSHQGSLVVLARSNAHVFGLRLATKGRLRINEGVDLEPAYNLLSQAETSVGNPLGLAKAVTELISKTSVGLTTKIRDDLSRSLFPDRIDFGRRKVVRPLLEYLAPFYDTPDIPTVCWIVRRIYQRPPDWLRIQLPESFHVLGQLSFPAGEDPKIELDRIVRYRKEAAFVPFRCASTIHKAKGREFDHVVIALCCRSPFPDTIEARRLLYVALSRARRSIHILVSAREPSPLVG